MAQQKNQRSLLTFIYVNSLLKRKLISKTVENRKNKTMAFSFIYDIFPRENPWQVTDLDFLRNHLFYHSLKNQPINLDRFSGALETLSEKKLDDMISNIPEEWHNDKISV